MPDEDKKIVSFAETNFRNEKRRFGIKLDDRRRHIYVIGKTGMGKSVTLENMIYQDIIAGRGMAIVDPHGDLAEKIITFIPSHRLNDVVYFNPSDLDFPIAFNVLEKVDREYQHLVASGLVGVFKKIWADSWGPRLEYLLRNAILALLPYPDSTMLGIMRLLTDKVYRKKIVDQLDDPVVKAFWIEEYSKYPDRFQTEAIAPIQNKVGQFLSSSLIRNIVGQVKSTINVRKIMDEGKILIMNFSKGRVGEDNSALLGAMMITKIQLAAMSRVDMPEEDRKDFYLYVDEFQNFSTESFANILSEARKYRLNLIIAHQYIEQLDETVRAAVFGNVGTFICFRVGAADAEFLVKEFAPIFTEGDLVNLPKYNVYMRLMIDGVASNPFSATTLPPISQDFGNLNKIIDISRERYAKSREVVEDKIKRWSGMEKIEAAAEAREAAAEKKEKERKTYPLLCWICNEKSEVGFEYDPKRPIYCNDCMTKIKAGELNTLSMKESRKIFPIISKKFEKEFGYPMIKSEKKEEVKPEPEKKTEHEPVIRKPEPIKDNKEKKEETNSKSEIVSLSQSLNKDDDNRNKNRNHNKNRSHNKNITPKVDHGSKQKLEQGQKAKFEEK